MLFNFVKASTYRNPHKYFGLVPEKLRNPHKYFGLVPEKLTTIL